jgi:UDP-N-acetylmuramate dehydrogenase
MASVLASLPQVRGLLQERVSLGKRCWFGTGGLAEILFIPEDMDDLIGFLRNIRDDTKITVLGAMSNVLIRSSGIRGIVIILGDWFKKIFVENDILEVGAAVHCGELSAAATDRELGGLEFLIGIPGTIGGAVKMNAGCHGSEIANALIECEIVTLSGQIKWLKASDMGFGYRTSGISDELIVTRAWFRGIPNIDYSIDRKIKQLLSKRSSNQPTNIKTCGSTFKNPKGKNAWELIEAAGCRGMRFGGAAISDKHCNFIVNENNATPEDIETLGEKVIEKVFENSGIRLEWEIIRLGDK